jgi:hypothetical protein
MYTCFFLCAGGDPQRLECGENVRNTATIVQTELLLREDQMSAAD